MIEGRAALSYFHAWRDVRIQWKGIGRNPIPREWDRMVTRQSSPSGSNRNARHPVNSILNYSFGILESQVRTAIQSVGLDPMLGYLHACYPGRVALVYDAMEPLRPRAEKLVLEFLQRQAFSPRDFILLEKGVCRLHPQLAKP